MQPTSHSTYDVAPTPEPSDFETVSEIPYDMQLDHYEGGDTLLDADAAAAIHNEIWRITRNPQYLELAVDLREHPSASLNLSFIAAQTITDGVLNPTDVASTFISWARLHYPELIARGPDAVNLAPRPTHGSKPPWRDVSAAP